MAALAEASPWLTGGDAHFDVVDSWPWNLSTAMPIVVVSDLARRGAAAFLVGPDGAIQRIPGSADLSGPVGFDGGVVSIPAYPVEGGVLAYLGVDLLPDELVELRPEEGRVTVSLPPDVTYPLVPTVSMSTPELSTAFALVVTS